jgi:hypothetical protein
MLTPRIEFISRGTYTMKGMKLMKEYFFTDFMPFMVKKSAL